jgi:hypothetical protein
MSIDGPTLLLRCHLVVKRLDEEFDEQSLVHLLLLGLLEVLVIEISY